MKFTLKKPLLIKNKEIEMIEINEIEITEDDFTAGVILDAEQNFLNEGGTYPIGQMEASRKYLAYVLAGILKVRVENLNSLDGKDIIKITEYLKGFFPNMGLQDMISTLLGKQQ